MCKQDITLKALKAPWLALLLIVAVSAVGYSRASSASDCIPGLDQEMRRLHSSETVNLCSSFGGRPLLIVNTASHCGFTHQFGALEKVHQDYADEGLVVIGFPSDDFNQESDDEAESAQICRINYGVSFTMLSPQSVKGSNAHTLFRYLADQTREPRWNFTKYLVSRDGAVTHRFGSRVDPDSRQFKAAIEKLL